MEFSIKSLSQLIDRVTPDDPSSETGHWRTACVYHGSADAEWPLLTSLDRSGGITPPHTKAQLEAHILRHFLRYARPYLSGRQIDEWELLMTAQHYGVPTRLLDWTYSPLIAAHFATAGQRKGIAAAIWQLDWANFTKRLTFHNSRSLLATFSGYSMIIDSLLRGNFLSGRITIKPLRV